MYSSSVYSCHLFLISSPSVRSIPFLSFIVPIFAWNVPLVSLIFLRKYQVFPILLFSSISLHWSLRKEKSESERHSVVSNSLWPHGLYSPWNSPGQNTGVGSYSLLQRIFPTQGSNPGRPHCRQILYQLSQNGNPRILEWVAYPFSSGSSQPRNWTMSPALQADSLPAEPQGKPRSLRKAFLSLLAILWNSAFRWVYLSFSPLPLASLPICKASSDNHFALLHFFFLGMVLITASYTMSWTSIHSSSGTLSDFIPWI